MGNMKSTKHYYKGSLWFLCLFFLGVAVIFASSSGPKKRPDPREMAQLAGRPDTGVGLVPVKGLATPAALPIPPFPPYEPVPMTYEPGTSGLVVYGNTNGVAMINPRTHTISPILLSEFDYTIDPKTQLPIGGQLGSEGGGRYDLAMTSDGRDALIGNFGNSKVFFIDLRSGTPVVSGMAKLDFFAEDIAIDPTDTWALVTDGGFGVRIAVLHIPTRTWVPAGMSGDDPPVPQSYSLPVEVIDDEDDPFYPGYNRSGCAVAIAADGRTVIVADYFSGALHVLLFDPASGALSFQQTERLWKYGTDGTALFPVLYRPVNVAIAPDGQTVMVANAERSTYPGDKDPDAVFEGCSIPVFTIDRPGHIVRHPDLIMPFEINCGQSLVYSADGRRAYLHTIYYDEQPDPVTADIYWQYSEVQSLAISGPGQVSRTGSVRLPTVRGTTGFFGVDTMAVTPDGNFLYVTNPTLTGATPVIDVIDLRSFTYVKSIGTPTHYPDPMRNWPNAPLPPDPDKTRDWIEKVLPTGIAFASATPNRRPVAVVSVDKSEVILDINEAATFDGSGSNDPEGSPLGYAWSLVSAPAGAAATLTPYGSGAVLTPDPHIAGAYQVGLVVNDGDLDSAMATASVTAKFYPVLPPSGAALQRLENNFIFYKEYVNRLTWQANAANKSALANYRVYRKTKGAVDPDYALVATLAPSVLLYEDKGLKKGQLFTYKITAVNTRGQEGDPVVVVN